MSKKGTVMKVVSKNIILSYGVVPKVEKTIALFRMFVVKSLKGA